MAIGSLGDVVFEASDEIVRTIRNVKLQGSAKYAEHEVIGGKPLLEFTGLDADSFTFDMFFSTSLGVIPIDEAKKLREIRDKGEAVLFVLDGEPQGVGLWAITQLSEDWEHMDKNGSPHYLSVSVSLKEYTEVA